MKIIRCFSLITVLALIVTGACGCMIKPGITNRIESDQEYRDLMLDYIEKKYDKDFEIVDSIFPEEGINSGQLQNYLIVRDTEDGVVTDVYSYLSSPYTYYDNYAADLASFRVRDSVSLEKLNAIGKAKLYLYLREENINDIDVSRENVSRAVLVVNINEAPGEDNLAALYEAYCELFLLDYEYIYLVAGFTAQSSTFEDYVESYRVFGVKDWVDFEGNVYATLNARDGGLTYESFKALCEMK